MKNRVYKNPPIREAIIDWRVHFDAPPDPKLFEDFFQLQAEMFSRRETIHQGSFSLKLEKGKPVAFDSSSDMPIGLRLTSGDAKSFAKVEMGGFSFSKLAPYAGWDLFFNEAEPLFRSYWDLMKPKYIERVGIRYINGVTIPLDSIQMEDYFKLAPQLPDELSGQVGQSFLKVVLFDKNNDCAVVSQILEDPKGEPITKILLDIDVSRDELNLLPSEELTRLILRLKDYRTDIFQSSLTEKTKALFD